MADGRSDRWFEGGLRFRCTRCGNCCTGPTGQVWIDAAEAARLARRLGLLPFEFTARYAREVDGRLSLREVERDGHFDCVFLERDPAAGLATCSVHDVRPRQCRAWPFWPENLRDREAWQRAGKGCPGMDRADGPRVDQHEIRRLRDQTPWR